MPTGYTAGILDGEITTFQQFAKSCIRNFGATIHMRDEPMSAEVIERKPSDYHIKEINKANNTIGIINAMSDDELIQFRTKELNESRQYYLEAIEKSKANNEKLNRFLEEARNYVPPTIDHSGYKSFMIDQITQTIEFDCNDKYYKDKLNAIDSELLTLSAATIKESKIKQALKDLDYHKEEHKKELQRCKESNEWISQAIKSIETV